LLLKEKEAQEKAESGLGEDKGQGAEATVTPATAALTTPTEKKMNNEGITMSCIPSSIFLHFSPA